MAHLQKVGPIVPQDPADPGIGQRPTSTERRSDSTSATASPPHNGIPCGTDSGAGEVRRGRLSPRTYGVLRPRLVSGLSLGVGPDTAKDALAAGCPGRTGVDLRRPR